MRKMRSHPASLRPPPQAGEDVSQTAPCLRQSQSQEQAHSSPLCHAVSRQCHPGSALLPPEAWASGEMPQGGPYPLWLCSLGRKEVGGEGSSSCSPEAGVGVGRQQQPRYPAGVGVAQGTAVTKGQGSHPRVSPNHPSPGQNCAGA